jgi:hypothetical protein
MGTVTVAEGGVSLVVAALLAWAWSRIFWAYVTREGTPNKGWTIVETKDVNDFLVTLAVSSALLWWTTYLVVQGYLRGGKQDTLVLLACIVLGIASLATPTGVADMCFRYLVYQSWRES